QTTIAQLEAAVAAGQGRAAWVQFADTDIPISTFNMAEGVYYAYAIDAAGNMSNKGVNKITIDDALAPTVIVAVQTLSNAPGNSVAVQSTDDEGFVYLIHESVPQATQGQLEAAVATNKGVKGYVFSALTDVTLVVSGINVGNYHAYAVDLNGNLSTRSSQVVTITQASRLKSMSSFSFLGTDPQSVGHIVGTLIDVEVPFGTDLANLISTFTISPLATAYVGLVEQISGVTSNSFESPVTYTVEAEDGTSLDYTVTVTVSTGIADEKWNESILVYPNPVGDRLLVQILKPLDRIVITDLLGQVIEDIVNPTSSQMEISASAWQPGLYMMQFYRGKKAVLYKKLIKD
ncbi:MAG: T9SS type A sorting domain-containing protein, partial [Bacteroidales bacterium]|nr:T9SS type A sorting domain-containing protein [Bacteroidales bacterium]